MALFKSITVALVGIGAVTPSKMLAASGNVFSAKELKSLSERGAVGDICLRFFDENGEPVVTPLNERVIAIELAALASVKRVIGIAGGRRKFAAIRGALRGRRINVLITDRSTAERLVKNAQVAGRSERDAAATAAMGPRA
jgi:DNA-binding transcriptional regulator LsrR (DeoR family)